MPSEVPERTWRKIANEMNEAVRDSKTAKPIALKWLKKLGFKSPNTIYNNAKRFGYNSQKKKKKDAGKISTKEKNKYLRLSQFYNSSPGDDPKEAIMPLWEAIDFFKAAYPGEPLPSISTIYQKLRLLKMSRRDIRRRTPKNRIRSEYPNQLWFYDSGVCDYYLDPKTQNILYISPTKDNYPGKAHRHLKKIRMVRHIIVDHFSASFIVWYSFYQKIVDYIDFFWFAMADKYNGIEYDGVKIDTTGFIFKGIPAMFITDNDIGLKSYPILQLMANIEVKVIPIS